MTESATETTPAAPQEPAQPTAAPTPTPAPPKPAEPAQKHVWDDPESARAEIERLRKENGAERVNAKAKAADEARNELAQQIGKALGLVEDEQVDPAKLTAELTASQQAAKQARVELAVFKAAADAGGDPAALLDSSSFLATLGDIDPSDTAAVSAAIKSAVESNPRLGAEPATRLPAPNPAQGASGGGPTIPAQLGKSDIENMTPEEITKAHEEGRFADLFKTGR